MSVLIGRLNILPRPHGDAPHRIPLTVADLNPYPQSDRLVAIVPSGDRDWSRCQLLFVTPAEMKHFQQLSGGRVRSCAVRTDAEVLASTNKGTF